MGNIFLLGEIVLDLIYKDNKFFPVPGGSALNTLMTLKYFDKDPLFFSEIGDDFAGNFILNFLKNNGLNIEKIFKSKEIKTTVSIAFLDENKDAKYNFYKTYYNKPFLFKYIKKIDFKDKDILFLSSFFAGDKRNNHIVRFILKNKKKKKFFLFYDPNIRIHHLKENRVKLSQIFNIINNSDVIRMSFEDLLNIINYLINSKNYFQKFKHNLRGFFYNIFKFFSFEYIIFTILKNKRFKDLKNEILKLNYNFVREKYKEEIIEIISKIIKKIKNNKIIVITDGAYEVNVVWMEKIFEFKLENIIPISTIGAGDSFNGSLLNYMFDLINEENNIFTFKGLSEIKIKEIIINCVKLSQEVCLSEYNYPLRK